MASLKTDAEVVIDGHFFTITGYESADYIQKVAAYINGKIKEFKGMDSFTRQSSDMQNVLIELNIADDYFKAKKQISMLEEDLAQKEKELYDIKHEMISAQIKTETIEKSLREAQAQVNEDAKKIVRLETELKKNRI